MSTRPKHNGKPQKQCSLKIWPPPTSTLFHYTTLFRSCKNKVANEHIALTADAARLQQMSTRPQHIGKPPAQQSTSVFQPKSNRPRRHSQEREQWKNKVAN